MALMPVDEALELLLAATRTLPAQTVPIGDCAGRTLAEPILARRTQPPFPASAMDGFAVRAQDTLDPQRRLAVIGVAPAGHPFDGVVAAGEAVRIFTGAPVPAGADAILIQENAALEGDAIRPLEPVAVGRNIRREGLDFREGEPLLPAGRLLDPAALSLAAAANHDALPVTRRPLVAIIATGDELVAPGSAIGPGQIVASNSYGVAAIARAAGAQILDLGIVADDRDRIAAALRSAVDARADVIVTLGGASVGEHDLVREIFLSLGARMDFWKIAMRPGKPLMAGMLGETRLLGLPGNPVASVVCSHLFLKPVLAALAGRSHRADIRPGVLGADIGQNDQRQDYVRATLDTRPDGTLVATPAPTQDSSMLRILADAGALVVRPPFAPAARAGEACSLLMLRDA